MREITKLFVDHQQKRHNYFKQLKTLYVYHPYKTVLGNFYRTHQYEHLEEKIMPQSPRYEILNIDYSELI